MMRPMHILLGAVALTVLGILVIPLPQTWINFSHPGFAATRDTASYRDVQWEELIPKEWDPTKRFRDSQLSFGDSSPQAIALLRDMRAIWDNAPTVQAMDGALIRLPGYVVPLEETKAGLKQFLLVPYFGACIHTPPPPANQILDVIIDHPIRDLQMMDAVWVSGTLKTVRTNSLMGASGYRLQAVLIEPYVPPKQ